MGQQHKTKDSWNVMSPKGWKHPDGSIEKASESHITNNDFHPLSLQRSEKLVMPVAKIPGRRLARLKQGGSLGRKSFE